MAGSGGQNVGDVVLLGSTATFPTVPVDKAITDRYFKELHRLGSLPKDRPSVSVRQQYAWLKANRDIAQEAGPHKLATWALTACAYDKTHYYYIGFDFLVKKGDPDPSTAVFLRLPVGLWEKDDFDWSRQNIHAEEFKIP